MPFLLKSWFEVKNIWTLDVTTGHKNWLIFLKAWYFYCASHFDFVLGDKSTAWRIAQLLLSITSRNWILCNPFRLTLKCEALHYTRLNYLVTINKNICHKVVKIHLTK
jgi:hypothetical protein